MTNTGLPAPTTTIEYRAEIFLILFLVVGALMAQTSACSDDGSPLQPDAGLGEDASLDAAQRDAEVDAAQDADTCQAMEQAFEQAIQNAATRGLVAGVDTPWCGRWLGATGTASLDSPMTTDALLRIGSVTKTFTAAAILSMVSEGTISLDDTVDQYVTGIPNGDVITIRNLLNHTSGMFDIVDDQDFMSYAMAHPDEIIPPEQLVEEAAAHESLFEPGTRAEYCNTGYHVLGLVLQQVTGDQASQVIRTWDITPLSLDHVWFEIEETPSDPLVPGYSPTGQDVTGVLNPSIRWTAGAMVATIGDLLTWTAALYSGHLLSADMTEAMTADPVPLGTITMGLGVAIRPVDDVGIVYGHSGSVPGYRTQIAYSPDFFVSVAVIANQSDTDVRAACDALMQLAVASASQ